jgi:hypothetical protein
MKINIQLLLITLLLIVGCTSPRISNAPVHAAYLGDTTTFEGNSSLRVGNYDHAKKIVKGALLSNGFKLVSEDNLNKQVVGRRKVDEGFVTTVVYFYQAPSTVNLRVVSQVPRNGTAYYRIHEEIMAGLK